jgi:hypothetical protein
MTHHNQTKKLITWFLSINVDRKLMPLSFAIMEKENNDKWGWFLHLVWRVFIGPRCEICVISNRHARILNAVHDVIPNHSHVYHHWCTRHLAQKLKYLHIL